MPQPRCGMRTRSPAHRRRDVAPCGSSTVNSVSPAGTWSSSSALCSSQGGRPEKLVTPHVQLWNRMCRSRLAVLRSHWQGQRVPFASRLAGSNRGPSRLVPPLPKAAPAYRENRRGGRKVTLIASQKLCVSTSFAVRPGENDHKPVGITNPYLLVLGF
jgi:hypothetical protein